MSPACNVEVGLDTAHLLTPPLAFVDLSPSVTVALTASVAISLGANLQLQPSAIGQRAGPIGVGAPLRLRLNDWFGLVGLERVFSVSMRWGGPLGSVAGLNANLPMGVLLQAGPQVSFEARVRPVVSIVPFAFSRLEFDVEGFFTPLRWLDVVLAGYVSPGDPLVIVASAGVRRNLST